MSTLYETLQSYCKTDAYPFHMPGHKRNQALLKEMCNGEYGSPYEIDITEIDGFDNLHHAEGILRRGQEKAAALYGAKESFYLINGSTCGLLASIFTCTSQNGTILMARNCHKAVYHGAELRGLKTRYLYPKLIMDGQINGPILAEDVEKELQSYPGIEAVLLTSPTYDGIVSDIGAIAEVVHAHGKKLIVDEAHGAHFGFHSFFPENSLKKGADLVIHSLHKTLPSMTQTALLSVGKDSDVEIGRVKKYLGIFETSSPSYVMMAGIDLCIEYLKIRGNCLFSAFAERLQTFYEQSRELKKIHVLRENNQDPSKIVIFADGLNGQELSERFREEYHLEMEMEARDYVIALTSIFDTEEGFNRLKTALKDLDRKLEKEEKTRQEILEISCSQEAVYRISAAASLKSVRKKLQDCVEEVSAEYMYLYPPGIPLIVPGERISEELLQFLQDVREKGFEIQGLSDYNCTSVLIIDNNA